MSSKPAIRVENLSKTYKVYARPRDRLLGLLSGCHYQPFPALKPISFEVRKGETLGIVGHNGSGKSTLLQLICGTLTPTTGTVAATGRISALLELGAGFNPEFTGRENIFLNAAILGLSEEEIRRKYDAIAEFSGIAEHLGQPVKTYSSGMVVRLGFAVAIAVEPEILIVDEALSVGDIAFQRKCFSRIEDLKAKGATVLFVSHAINTVLELCDRALLLDHGELLMDGEPGPVMAQYQRLMFAPAKALGGIRSTIRSGKEAAEKPAPASGYDPSLMPESRVDYVSQGAQISHVELTDLKGKRVNLLKRGETYRYSYTVKFKESANDVRFGMSIKTNTGMVLGGASTHTEKKPVPEVKRGRTAKVSFEFTCRLLPGTYFTNAGCTGVRGGERLSLHRILDACMFRVLGEGGTATGKVDFGITSKVTGI
jgi:lipopolysaccharide transport system ATP-binding protein